MSKTYEMAVRRLSLDSSVEGYKTYLIYGFIGVELIFGTWLKFDMKGFAQHQISNMHNYEKLLVELGEKSYVPGDSKWPVEMRLLFTIVIQAGLFILGKVMMKKTGSNIMNMMGSMMGGSGSGSGGGGGMADMMSSMMGGMMGGGGGMNKPRTPSNVPKKKMRGPKINLDDINDLDSD